MPARFFTPYMKKNIIFDFYDTLCKVDEEKFLNGKKDLAAVFGTDFDTFFRAWRETGRRNITGELRTTAARLSEITAILEIKRDKQVIEEAAKKNDEAFALSCSPYPEALDAVKAAKAGGYDLFILSNASSNIRAVWNRNFRMFEGLFNKIYFSCDHGFAKPDGNFFKLLIEKEGIRPADSYYTGDGNDLELDVAGSYGFTTIKVSHEVLGVYRFSESTRWDIEIASLSELMEKIKKNEQRKE